MNGRVRKKNIMYIQCSPGIGGSVSNVLHPMVVGLNRDLYEPLVLFYWPNPYRERFEAMGIKTMLFDKPRARRHPGPVAQLQKSELVKGIQRGKDGRSALYYALGSYVRLSYCIPQILRLAELIKISGADLVHLNRDPAVYGREIVLASKLAGTPVICYAQNFSEFQSVDRQIARFVDQYVFCSDAIGEHCVTQGGAVLARSLTIYPGVADVEKWSKPYDTSEVRRELGWSDEDFVVGNIGRLVSWKGQDVFLKALAEAKREIPDIKGLVVGGPIEPAGEQDEQPALFYEQLLALTESLGIRDNVHFTGFRSDIPQIMASIDVLAHSSSEPEPFATVVIEGMMAGRPVVAVNAGGMPEMIEDGVTGRLVPTKDPRAMAQAILLYYRDRTLTKQVAMAGQRMATTQLTAQRHIDKFHTLYHTLLSNSTGPRQTV